MENGIKFSSGDTLLSKRLPERTMVTTGETIVLLKDNSPQSLLISVAEVQSRVPI